MLIDLFVDSLNQSGGTSRRGTVSLHVAVQRSEDMVTSTFTV
jgi:hypothetical protein